MYAPRNIGGLVTSRTSIRPQSSLAVAAFALLGLTIDREPYQSALFKLTTGAVTGAPSAIQITSKLQDSADGTTWADVAASQANPAVTFDTVAANASNVIEIDLSGLRRYVRMVHTVAFTGGTTPSILLAGECVLGGSMVLPTAHA